LFFRPGGAFTQSLNAVMPLFGVNSKCSYRHDYATELGYDPKASTTVLEDDDAVFAVNRNNALLWKVCVTYCMCCTDASGIMVVCFALGRLKNGT
jgi:hypothetical protein